MAKRNDISRAHEPEEILTPMDGSEPTSTGRRPDTKSDPGMRDGDASHGSPYETDVGEVTTDNDVGDELEGEPPFAGRAGGAVGGTPAEGRAEGGKTGGGISSSGASRGDSTIGTT